jgi:hypothetical protein
VAVQCRCQRNLTDSRNAPRDEIPSRCEKDGRLLGTVGQDWWVGG